MQDARTRWWATAALVAAVATACGGGGGDEPRATRVRADAEPVSGRSSTTTTTSAPPAPAPAPVATTSTTAAPVTTAGSPAPPAPVVTVSVAALEGGSVKRSDGAACSSTSSQSLARGRLEVRRSGPAAAPLTVRYTASGTASDFTPLPGVVTIPAGASSAIVEVTPTMTFTPAPQHVHRSSSVSIALVDDPGYDLGAPTTAAVTLTFDVDVYGCDTPAP